MGQTYVVVLAAANVVSIPKLLAQPNCVDAILAVGFLGQSGSAVAEVVFGLHNPAAKTVNTWVKSIADLPPMMSMDMRQGPGRTYRYFNGTPAFPFGHGLSYTQFGYSAMKANQTSLQTCDSLSISAT